MRTILTTVQIGLLVAGLATGIAAAAQPSPVGLWRNIDDTTGKPRAEIRIADIAGALSARIERSLGADPSKEESHCSRCTDDRKGQPIIGMEIVRGARRSPDSPWWEGGTILDPDNGKTYTLRLRIEDNGKALLLRGYIGPFYRSQTWERIQ
jgi:uncharacterized protein (DUF2147 family)